VVHLIRELARKSGALTARISKARIVYDDAKQTPANLAVAIDRLGSANEQPARR